MAVVVVVVVVLMMLYIIVVSVIEYYTKLLSHSVLYLVFRTIITSFAEEHPAVDDGVKLVLIDTK